MSKVYPRAKIHKSLISGDPYPWKLYFSRGFTQTPTYWFWYRYSTFDEAVSEANRHVRRARGNPASQ